MLSCADVLKSKGGDAKRKSFKPATSTPSIVAFKVPMPTPLMIFWAQASRSTSVLPKNGGCSTFEHSALRIGKKRGTSNGTVHVRVTDSPVNVPTRKNTGC